MVSREHIVQAWQQRRQVYAFDGSCVLASAEAEEWLSDARHDTKPATGLLVTSRPPLLLVSGVIPSSTTRACTRMYTLENGCVWVHSTSFAPMQKSGGLHHVMQLDASSFLDWSLDQFTLSPGAELTLYL